MKNLVLYNSDIDFFSNDLKNYNIYNNYNLYNRAKKFFIDIANEDNITNFDKKNKFIILNNKFLNFISDKDINEKNEGINIKNIFSDFDLFISLHKNPIFYDKIFRKNNMSFYHINFGKSFNPIEDFSLYSNNTFCFDMRSIETFYSMSDIRLQLSDLIEKIPSRAKDNKFIEIILLIDLSISKDSKSTYYDEYFNSSVSEKYKFSNVYDKISSENILKFISYLNYLKNEKNNYFNKPKIKGLILDLSKINDFMLDYFDKIMLECRLFFE